MYLSIVSLADYYIQYLHFLIIGMSNFFPELQMKLTNLKMCCFSSDAECNLLSNW